MNIEQLKQYKPIDLLTIINMKNKSLNQLKDTLRRRRVRIKDLKEANEWLKAVIAIVDKPWTSRARISFIQSTIHDSARSKLYK